MPPAFGKDEYAARQHALQRLLVDRDVDVCVITAPESVCYLTGHATPGYYTFQALVLPQQGAPHLVMRETETVNAAESTYLEHLHGFADNHDPIAVTADVARRAIGQVGTLGVEQRSWFLTPEQHNQLLEIVQAAVVAALDGDVASLRLIKSSAEITYIREAADIVNAAMAEAVSATTSGAKERDVAATIFSSLISGGSGRLGMEPFVASGPRSGSIHASWTDRVIRDGEPVLLEFAASREHYHAALMHTVPVGKLSTQLQALAETCERARQATVKAIRPGATGENCHRACVQAIEADGLLDHYRKRTGYSIGLAFAPDWGEGALFSLGYDQHKPMQPGMVIHAVPALRIPGVGGYGLSSTVLVTQDGNEVLTTSP